MASGHVNRIKGRTHGCTDQCCTREKSPCQLGAVHTWPDGHAIALGFGRTPISQGDETRLASPCNIWANAVGDVKALKTVKAGTKIKVSAAS